jgi:hypothetical protein
MRPFAGVFPELAAFIQREREIEQASGRTLVSLHRGRQTVLRSANDAAGRSYAMK